MKEQLIINHDAERLTEALGITSEELTRVTHDIVINYASNPAYTSVSVSYTHLTLPTKRIV